MLRRRDARVVCHDGRLHRTGRRLEMTHKKFTLVPCFKVWACLRTVCCGPDGRGETKDRVYGSNISDAEFYHDADAQLS